MIQPILNSIYSKKNNIIFKKTKISDTKKENNENFCDTFEKRMLAQKEKTNLLLSLIAGVAICKVLIDLFSKTASSTIKRDSVYFVNEFKSLKNDKEVVDLKNCKSINKDLQKLLKRQIDHMNAGTNIIYETGEPKASNRLLLYGPAGVGKSYFAKVFAKSTNAEYTEILYSDFNSLWSGEHINNFKQIFENTLKVAKENPNKKYVITFNEIDTLVQPANKYSQQNFSSHYLVKLEERSTFLNYLELLEKETPNVTVIGTTNVSPENNGLDQAAMSRFQNLIEVSYPEQDCLYEALKMNLDKVKDKDKFLIENDNELKAIAEQMAKRKFSFRNLIFIVNEAKNCHLEDSMKGNKKGFKVDYLKESIKNLKLSDGELENKTNKIT